MQPCAARESGIGQANFFGDVRGGLADQLQIAYRRIAVEPAGNVPGLVKPLGIGDD